MTLFYLEAHFQVMPISVELVEKVPKYHPN